MILKSWILAYGGNIENSDQFSGFAQNGNFERAPHGVSESPFAIQIAFIRKSWWITTDLLRKPSR